MLMHSQGLFVLVEIQMQLLNGGIQQCQKLKIFRNLEIRL